MNLINLLNKTTKLAQAQDQAQGSREEKNINK